MCGLRRHRLRVTVDADPLYTTPNKENRTAIQLSFPCFTSIPRFACSSILSNYTLFLHIDAIDALKCHAQAVLMISKTKEAAAHYTMNGGD